jgi:hypothetical protein
MRTILTRAGDARKCPKALKARSAPADVIGNAVHVMKVLTGEAEESLPSSPNRAKGGKVGGKRRAESLSKEERADIARKAASARWQKDQPKAAVTKKRVTLTP